MENPYLNDFSPSKQHGCSAGGFKNDAASIHTRTEAATDNGDSQPIPNRQAEFNHGTQQESYIER